MDAGWLAAAPVECGGGESSRSLPTILGVISRQVLAGTALLWLVAVAGCSVVGDAEHDEIVRAVDGVMGDLGAGNYAGARGRLCQEYSVDTLHEEFEGYAKPWRYKITGSEFTRHSSGLVNVTITAADKREQAYTLDMSYRDGRWQACQYLHGTYSSTYTSIITYASK
jgi:hypothetical protein